VGVALSDLERYEEAIPYFERAVRADPSYTDALHHLARTCSRAGRFEEAIEHGARLVELENRGAAWTARARYELGRCWIQTGMYSAGWRSYEARLETPPWGMLTAGRPVWDGSPLNGGNLLVRWEGGIGDAIQFARFLPLVRARVRGTVLLECRPNLMELLCDAVAPVKLVSAPVDLDDPPEPYDFQVSIVSLPAIFGTTEETIPPAILPIRVPEEERAAWRRRLSPLAGLKVGLCWAGSSVYDEDHDRSMRLESLAPLADIEGLDLVSLQLGPPADEIDAGRHGLDILHLPEELSPFTKTAALMRELDLVISVDTSIAHLGGALGVETWLLLPFVSHWIWNAYRPNDTPWYPTHRLFRQPHLKDWDSVVARVRDELVVRIADRGANPNRDE
jgi:hypothetical protein